MDLDDLTPKQRDVIEVLLGSVVALLVTGGPGTGKTTTALWAARLFLETNPGSGRVLFVTFSRAATRHVTARMPGILAGASGHVEITTFHALAYRILKAFGRYAGQGPALAQIQSEAERKLFGVDKDRFVYDDLVPAALSLIERSATLGVLLTQRWPLVICDEAQDIDDTQWNFLSRLSQGRLLLLGDPNQMIYTFVPGVSAEGFAQVRRLVDKEIELERRSHRDPSGVIPALSRAVLRREFHDLAVTEAINNGYLSIVLDVERSDHTKFILQEIKKTRGMGLKSVSIFAHSNQGVADLAARLDASGIDYTLVGIPEAHREALGAMSMMCAFASNIVSWDHVKQALALFMTSITRGKRPPDLAIDLVNGWPLPEPLENALESLRLRILETSGRTVGQSSKVAMAGWTDLPITRGQKSWRGAASHFGRLIAQLRHQPVSGESTALLRQIVEAAGMESLVEVHQIERAPVTLMNFHQTKGREADTVIHVYQPDDYFGDEKEPFPDRSRLLHVSLSRARRRIVILLPPTPHPLVAPFRDALRYAQA